MTDVVSTAPASPYKGLAHYTEEDAAFFFGRDREREVIIANAKARPLTLLYGESGVGKSSLLRAGVASQLLLRARENVEDLGGPEYVPLVFSDWRDDPLRGLADAIRGAVAEFTSAEVDLPGSRRLDEMLVAAGAAVDGSLLIVLDQFEEYFLYHPREHARGTFAAEFARAVNRVGLQAGFVVSIREDALAKLDRFQTEIPKLFDNYLRVRHLDVATAREAILRPVEQYNEIVGPDRSVTVERALVDAVVDQIRTGQVVLEQSGQGALRKTNGAGHVRDRVETPYLQLVMTRLWDSERDAGSHVLRLASLNRLGGAQEIVRTHLDAALRNLSPQERDVAASIFHHLVTPSGAKIAHAASDLAVYCGRPELEVQALLEKLARGETRIVRPVPPPPGEERAPRFEIFHDVLAPTILDWRTRQTAERRAAEQRRASRAAARRRILRAATIAGFVAFLAVASLAIYALRQRDQAADERNKAEAATIVAKRAAALAEELAAFNPRVNYAYLGSPSRLVFTRFRVYGQPGVRVRVGCAGCSQWDTTIRGTKERYITVPTLRGHRLRSGRDIRILITRGNVGTLVTLTPNGLAVTRQDTKCRPPGSVIPRSKIPAACPSAV